MGSKFGVSFSWRRAVGLSAAKARISRTIGIPLTRAGRERKMGHLVMGCLGKIVLLIVLIVVVLILVAIFHHRQ